jgi:hypothetical protein
MALSVPEGQRWRGMRKGLIVKLTAVGLTVGDKHPIRIAIAPALAAIVSRFLSPRTATAPQLHFPFMHHPAMILSIIAEIYDRNTGFGMRGLIQAQYKPHTALSTIKRFHWAGKAVGASGVRQVSARYRRSLDCWKSIVDVRYPEQPGR